MPTKLESKQQELVEKQNRLAKAFDEAGDDLDFGKESVLKLLDDAKDSVAAVEKVREWSKELEGLGKEVAELRDLKKQADDLREAINKPVNAPSIPGKQAEPEAKGIGQLVMESTIMRQHRESNQGVKGLVDGYGLPQLKTTFQTSDGWPPESTRVPGLVIDYATRPIQILDIIPTGRTDQAAVVYMYESTLTHASAERNEAAAYAESEFDLTETSSTVRSIGASIPVTDEQLEDVSGVMSYLQQRLTFGNRQRLDYQIVQGDGVAPNLTGILNASGLQTQAKSIDPVPDAIHKAMTKVRVTGRANVSHVLLHPNDWEAIRLLRTNQGVYIWGSPSGAGPLSIWGVPVVVSDVLTENTGIVGDFSGFCQLYERRGMEVLVGWDSDDFTKGIRTVRAGLRVAFVVYRGAAFCTVTGI